MTTSPITSRRSLHLVDLENLVGDPRAGAAVALDTFDAYLDAAHWSAGDHLIVACNPWLMTKIAFDLPTACSKHAAHDRDGADTMLLALAPPELVVKRYGRLVVGSGDGIFAGRAIIVRERGVHVDVVARPDGCSTRLHRFGCTFLAPRAIPAVPGTDPYEVYFGSAMAASTRWRIARPARFRLATVDRSALYPAAVFIASRVPRSPARPLSTF